MNNFIKISYTLIGWLCLSFAVLADDTEIYGATAIDENNRVNSNVLLIVDTSGSMDGEVEITLIPFDSSQTYSGGYNTNKVYYLNWWGRYKSGGNITSMGSTACSDEVVKLNSVGKVFGDFSISRSGITCDAIRNISTNLLFSGKYLNWKSSSDNITTTTRLQVVKDVVDELASSLTNINLGLMRFNKYNSASPTGHGGVIDVPVSPIEDSRALIKSTVNNYESFSGTPLTGALYEAARYYRGENWVFGNNDSAATTRKSSTSAQYKTPIKAACQKNHVILLTDGEPYNDTDANSSIENWITDMALPGVLVNECASQDTGIASGNNGNTGVHNGACLDELAYWMQNSDHSTGTDGFINTQNITTYTIGGFELANGVELLKRTADYGGGRYYAADDTTGLTDALDSIFLDILATDSTFTAPAVSVNAFNASEHRDELFYALFRPADNVKWSGNLKKYRLTKSGLVVGQGTESPAISETTGFFNESVFDYWNDSDAPDGKNVELGGVANKVLAPTSRSIYTENSANDLGAYTTLASQTSFAMTTDTEDEFKNVLNWSIGLDVDDQNGDGSTTDSRKSIGDPLHSEPVIVTYGGSDDAPDSTIYFGTNEGFIHAIDTVSGEEEFAFIPNALHAIQNTYYENTAAAANKPYGMDGPISTWFYDKNGNNVLYDTTGTVKDTGEHVYLYAGMRRGGNNYYALDVSNRNAPTMKFKIEGGKGVFSKLGQTWSSMTPAKVKFANDSKFVLFFTGGYDTNQDSNTVRKDDTVGNAIYMVDASNGDLLWWSSNLNADLNIETMTNSMPASISAVDITGDGYINYLFAADTGGRVFRIDIKQDNTGKSNFAQGGEIASLAGDDATNNRRFYNKPNVALVKDKQYGDYLTIAIGSGYRAHPIQTKDVKNRFYVIKDYNPYAAPTTYASVSEAPLDKISLATSENADPLKLYNASALMIDGDIALTSEMQVLMNNGAGWYVEMKSEGEKVLAQSTTFSGAIIFTSFAPAGDSSGSNCGADTGTSRTYALSQKLAMSVIDLDGDGDTDNDDASKILAHSGIAPRPVVIYREGGGKTIAIGTETIDDNRFDSDAPEADDPCIANGTCEEASKCETGNCYVNPVYWRQNDNNLIAPQE